MFYSGCIANLLLLIYILLLLLNILNDIFGLVTKGIKRHLLEGFNNARKLDLFNTTQGRNTHSMSKLWQTIWDWKLWNYHDTKRMQNPSNTTVIMNYPSIQTTKILQHYTPHNNLSIFNLYEPTHKKYEINLTETTREIWISNHNNIEATFDDIIQKARQIKEKKFWEQWITMYNATGVGILGTLMIVIFLAYQNSWSTTNHIYHECCRNKRKKGTKDKGTVPCP